MISLCKSERDVEEILAYIGDDRKKTPYLYMDTVKYGIGAPYVKTWTDRNGAGELQSVYLFYYDCLHFFTRDAAHYPIDTFFNAVGFLSPNVIIVPDSVGGRIENRMSSGWLVEKSHIIDMDKVGLDYQGLPCELVGREDIPEIADLMMMDEVYTSTYNRDTLEAQMLERYDEKFSRYYVIREGSKIVAAYSTYGETANLVVIGGLIVHADCRRKGYANRLMGYVCHLQSLKGGKKIAFVADDNTASLNLHKKLGALPIALQFKFTRKQG